MISTRRISTVLAVAAAFSALGATAATAAPTSPLGPPINPVTELDAVTTMGIPEESRGEFPGIAEQLGGLSRVNELGQLTQLTDQASFATGLLPEIS
ncbi:hypothetical protein AB0G79_26440 [Streptomyces sp. NPDC020807]|uniref:hypothetical protein n=1 Tax=Streptomyces sp. NPDC020807 TaxID=3155119 RepID=UPI0033E559FE